MTEHTAIVVIDMIPGCLNEEGRIRDPRQLETQIKAIAKLAATRKPTYLIECGRYNGKYGPTLPEITNAAHEPIVILKKDQSAFYGTNLDQQLNARGIHTIALAGVNTNWCIRSTAVHARDLGYDLITSPDLLGDFEWADPTIKRNTNEGLEYLKRNAEFHETVDDVIERIKSNDLRRLSSISTAV